MTARDPQIITVGEGGRQRKIAYLSSPPRASGAPGVLWLIGLKSDMATTKAEALAQWTAERGLGFTRFDYSGHGQSEGDFEDATISDWLEEAEAVFRQVTTGPQIIVGSSTGGHVALLLLRRLMKRAHPEDAERVTGLVLIAPAWDLTEELMWKVFPPQVARRRSWRRACGCGRRPTIRAAMRSRGASSRKDASISSRGGRSIPAVRSRFCKGLRISRRAAGACPRAGVGPRRRLGDSDPRFRTASIACRGRRTWICFMG